LARRELIEPVETRRDGRRPERTVYAITELGQRELTDWLSELVVTPAKEYPQFEAALSLLCGLAPDDALALLRQRVDALTMRLTQSQAARKAAHEYGLPRLFDLEGEYADALMRAELEFVEKLVTDLEGGTLEGVDEWRGWYSNESGHRQWFPSEEGSS
jgi:DNA-binding PadR family transcriptional regulator